MPKSPTPAPEITRDSKTAIAEIVSTIVRAIDAFVEENAALRRQDLKSIEAMRARKMRISGELQRQKSLLQALLNGPAAEPAAHHLVHERLTRLREVIRENCSLLNASKVVTHMRIEAVMTARQQVASAGKLYDREGRQIRAADRDAGALKPSLRI